MNWDHIDNITPRASKTILEAQPIFGEFFAAAFTASNEWRLQEMALMILSTNLDAIVKRLIQERGPRAAMNYNGNPSQSIGNSPLSVFRGTVGENSSSSSAIDGLSHHASVSHADSRFDQRYPNANIKTGGPMRMRDLKDMEKANVTLGNPEISGNMKLGTNNSNFFGTDGRSWPKTVSDHRYLSEKGPGSLALSKPGTAASINNVQFPQNSQSASTSANSQYPRAGSAASSIDAVDPRSAGIHSGRAFYNSASTARHRSTSGSQQPVLTEARLFRLICEIALLAIDPNVPKRKIPVQIAGLRLLEKALNANFLDFVPVRKALVSLRKPCTVLIALLGDSNARLHKSAEKCLSSAITQLGPSVVLPTLTSHPSEMSAEHASPTTRRKITPRLSQVGWKNLEGRLDLVYNMVSICGKPSLNPERSYSVQNLMTIIITALNSPIWDVRHLAIEVATILFQHVGLKLLPFFRNIPENLIEQLNLRFSEVDPGAYSSENDFSVALSEAKKQAKKEVKVGGTLYSNTTVQTLRAAASTQDKSFGPSTVYSSRSNNFDDASASYRDPKTGVYGNQPSISELNQVSSSDAFVVKGEKPPGSLTVSPRSIMKNLEVRESALSARQKQIRDERRRKRKEIQSGTQSSPRVEGGDTHFHIHLHQEASPRSGSGGSPRSAFDIKKPFEDTTNDRRRQQNYARNDVRRSPEKITLKKQSPRGRNGSPRLDKRSSPRLDNSDADESLNRDDSGTSHSLEYLKPKERDHARDYRDRDEGDRDREFGRGEYSPGGTYYKALANQSSGRSPRENPNSNSMKTIVPLNPSNPSLTLNRTQGTTSNASSSPRINRSQGMVSDSEVLRSPKSYSIDSGQSPTNRSLSLNNHNVGGSEQHSQSLSVRSPGISNSNNNSTSVSPDLSSPNRNRHKENPLNSTSNTVTTNKSSVPFTQMTEALERFSPIDRPSRSYQDHQADMDRRVQRALGSDASSQSPISFSNLSRGSPGLDGGGGIVGKISKKVTLSSDEDIQEIESNVVTKRKSNSSTGSSKKIKKDKKSSSRGNSGSSDSGTGGEKVGGEDKLKLKKKKSEKKAKKVKQFTPVDEGDEG